MKKVFKTFIFGLLTMFIVIMGSASINAVVPVTTGTTSYNDISSSHQNYPAIDYLSANKIIQGYPNGSIGANQSINRAEFVKIILEAKENTENNFEIKYDPSYSFPDIKSNDWFAKYVSTAKKEGILEGYPDGLFHPERNINYVEATKIITNTFNIKEHSLNKDTVRPIYQTESQDNWYYPYLKRAETTNTFFVENDQEKYNFDLSKPISRGTAFENLYRTIIIEKEDLTVFPNYKVEFADYRTAADFVAGEEIKIPVFYSGDINNLNLTVYKVSDPKYLAIDPNLIQINDDLPVKINKNIELESEGKNQYWNNMYPASFELPTTEPGIYYLELTGKYMNPSHLLINVTNYAMASQEDGKKNLIWVLNHNKKPAYAAVISSYQVNQNKEDKNQYTFTSQTLGSTNTQGILYANDINNHSALIAKIGNEYVSLIKNNFQSIKPMPVDTEMPIPPANEKNLLTTFSYTEKPIYKPGDTINFKSILRIREKNGYEIPATGTNVKVTIGTYKNGEKKIYDKTLQTNQYGSISDTFDISKEVSTGNYYLNLELENQENQSSHEYNIFQIQAYKKDEYQITIDTAKTDYVDGETVKVNLNANYFFGNPVKNETINYKVSIGRTYNYPTPLRDDEFLQKYQADILPEPYNYRQTIIKEGSGTLNEDGSFTFEFPANASGEQNDFYREKVNYQTLYQIEATVTDASNQPVSESKNITVHPAQFKIETKSLTPLAEVDEEYQLQIKTIDHNEKPYTNANLNVVVYNESYHFMPGAMCDIFEKCIIPPYDNYQKTTVSEDTIKSNSNGEAIFNFTPLKPGRYQIQITGEDSAGRQIQTSHYLHIYGEKDGYYYGNQYESIIIQPEYELYKTGEDIKLNVFSNSSNNYALVNVYKDEMINYYIVALKNGKGTLTIKTTDIHAPSIGICAIALNNKNSFVKTNRNLKVIPEDKKLNISVTPNKNNYLPGEKATFTITAKDIYNRPVTGEISFALVDKAIFNLLSGDLDNIYYTFYQGNQYYNLNFTGSDRDQGNSPIYYATTREFGLEEDAVFEAVPLAAPMAGNAVMKTADADNGESFANSTAGAGQPGLDQAIRKIFKDTAYFNGQIVLNNNGQATVTLDLPHNLTTWVGTAIGHTKDTKVGSGTGEVITQKNLMISSHLPRFVTEKDSVVFRTTVHNRNSDNNLTINLTSTGFTADTNSQNISVPKGSSKTIEWPVTINEYRSNKTIQAKFEVKEVSGINKDTLISTLPINRVGTEKITSKSGEDNASINIIADTGDLNNIESIKVDISPTLAENIIKSIEYLTGYPYGCVEQTMSKFLPNVIAYKNRNALGIAESEIFEDMDKKVQTGLDRLYNYQHSDGGWGWWENDLSNKKNSAYVMYGLTLAKEAGYEIDDNVYNQGINYLIKKIDDEDYRPYIQYVLSLAAKYNDQAKNQTASFNYYEGKLNNLSTADISYLIMTEVNVHGSLKSQTLKTALINKITTVGNMSHINEETIDYENMGSKELSTALAIEALAIIDANNPQIPNMIRWLDSRKQGYVYHETHATAHAIIAIVEYVKNTAGSNPDYTYEISLNDSVISSGKLDEYKSIDIPVSSLNIGGENIIKISKNGRGKLYYTFIQKEFLPKDNLDAIDNGINVKRSYYDKNGLKVNTLKVGDIVRAEVTIKSNSDLNYLLIEDKLPAGLEPVNTALKRDENTDYERYDYRYNNYVDHRDLLDDKTAMFKTRLPSGEYKYSYYLRAVTPGTFTSNPAMAYPMYAPEINGSSASDSFTITK